jgi:hypothetical protein
MEAEDFAQAARAVALSPFKIDQEHRAIMKECLAESLDLAPLYDVTIEAISGNE